MISTSSRMGLFECRWVLLASSLLLLAACATSPAPKLTLLEHPLNGKIWDVQAQAFIDEPTLLRKMLAAEYLLLGEWHDNRVHHQHQIQIIQQLQQARRQVSVAFEMIDDQQGELLARHSITSVEELIALLEQITNQWDYELNYKDLFAQIITAGFPIMPANLNRQRLNQIVTHGEDKLPASYKKMLLQAPLSIAQMKSLQQEIKQSHCNMLDDEASKKIMLAQRVRDAVIAHSLVRNQAEVKVLIAGAGHVRKDRGVPLYIVKQAGSGRLVTLGFAEVSVGANEAGDYAERWGTNKLPFDFVWFTPQVERSDLCASLKKLHKGETGKAP